MAFLLFGCASPGHHSQNLEYKVIEGSNFGKNLEPALNTLAKEGWTVVSSSTYLPHGSDNPFTQVILKRPRAKE